jgi:hypothetical protein
LVYQCLTNDESREAETITCVSTYSIPNRFVHASASHRSRPALGEYKIVRVDILSYLQRPCSRLIKLHVKGIEPTFTEFLMTTRTQFFHGTRPGYTNRTTWTSAVRHFRLRCPSCFLKTGCVAQPSASISWSKGSLQHRVRRHAGKRPVLPRAQLHIVRRNELGCRKCFIWMCLLFPGMMPRASREKESSTSRFFGKTTFVMTGRLSKRCSNVAARACHAAWRNAVLRH